MAVRGGGHWRIRVDRAGPDVRTIGPVLVTSAREEVAKGWVVVVALAALSLLHGKWQPMVFFAVVGVLSSGFFWFGCKSNK